MCKMPERMLKFFIPRRNGGDFSIVLEVQVQMLEPPARYRRVVNYDPGGLVTMIRLFFNAIFPVSPSFEFISHFPLLCSKWCKIMLIKCLIWYFCCHIHAVKNLHKGICFAQNSQAFLDNICLLARNSLPLSIKVNYRLNVTCK